MTDARGSSALHSLFQRALLKSLSFSRKKHQLLPKTNVNCGSWANEIVYEKLPEGVLEKLKNRNPVLPTTKRRRWKFTQFLSYDLGQPDLKRSSFAGCCVNACVG